MAPLYAQVAPRPPAVDTKRLGVAAVVVELGPRGFAPSQVTLPPGKFYLYVKNLIGKPALSLSNSARPASPLRSVRLDNPKGARNWGEVLELAEGDYVVGDGEAGSATLRITVKK